MSKYYHQEDENSQGCETAISLTYSQVQEKLLYWHRANRVEQGQEWLARLKDGIIYATVLEVKEDMQDISFSQVLYEVLGQQYEDQLDFFVYLFHPS